MEPTPEPYDGFTPADFGTDRPADLPAFNGGGAASVPPPSVPAPPRPLGVSGLVRTVEGRPVPDDVHASYAVDTGDDARPCGIIDMGTTIRRETIANALAASRVKCASADIDALTVVAGYALSVAAAHIVQAVCNAVAASRDPKYADGSNGADAWHEPLRIAAANVATANNALASLAAALAPIDSATAETITGADRDALLFRRDLFTGCAFVSALIGKDHARSPIVALSSQTLAAATASMREALGEGRE